MSYQLPGAPGEKGGSVMSDGHRLLHHHHQQQHHHHHHQQQLQQQQLLQQPPHHHGHHHHHHHAGQRDAAIAAWSRCNSSSNNVGARAPGLGAATCEGDPAANTLPSRRGAPRAAAAAFRSHGRTDARSPLALAKVEAPAPAPYGDSHCKSTSSSSSSSATLSASSASSTRAPTTTATAAIATAALATAATAGRLCESASGQRDLAQYVRGYLEASGRDAGAEWEERYYATFSRSVECCSSDNNSRETSPQKAKAAFSTADSSKRRLRQRGTGRGVPNAAGGDSAPTSRDAGPAAPASCARSCEGDLASEGGGKSETRLTAVSSAHDAIPRIDIHECYYDDDHDADAAAAAARAAGAADESGAVKAPGAAMGNSEQKGVQVGNSFSRSTKAKPGGGSEDGKERGALSVMHSIGVQTEAACKQNNGGGCPSVPSAPSSNAASKRSSDGLSSSADGVPGMAGAEKRSTSDEEGSEGIRDDISDIFRFLDDVSVCDSGTGPLQSRNDSCNSLARHLKSDSDCTPERTPRRHAEQPAPLGSLTLREQDQHLLQEVQLLQQEYQQQQHKQKEAIGRQQTQPPRVPRQRGANEPDDELKVSVCKLVLRMGEIERKLETLTGVRAEISEVLAKLNKLDDKLVQEALPCLQSPGDEKPEDEYDDGNGQQRCGRGHRAHKSESGTEWGSSDASGGDSLRVQALRRSLLGRRSSRSLTEENSATESKLVSMAGSPHGDWKSGGGGGGGGGVAGGGCGMTSAATNGPGAVETVAGCSNISGCPGMGGGGNGNLVTSGLYVYEPGREYERRERYGDGQSGPIQMEVGYAFSAKPDNVQADEALMQQVYGGRISASTLRAHMKSNPLYREVPAGPGGGPEAEGHRRGQPSWTLEEYTRHAKQRGKLSAIDLQTQESLNPNNLEYWMEEIYTPGYDSLLKRKEAEFRRAKLCKIAVLVLVAVCTVVLVIVVPICTVRT